MKVHELMAKLERCDPQAEVFCSKKGRRFFCPEYVFMDPDGDCRLSQLDVQFQFDLS